MARVATVRARCAATTQAGCYCHLAFDRFYANKPHRWAI